jgi:hypothetical protein
MATLSTRRSFEEVASGGVPLARPERSFAMGRRDARHNELTTKR